MFILTSSLVAGQRTILVLGDSISAAYGINSDQGWVALLQQRLLENRYPYDVVNASVSGDTTRTGLNRLPDAVKKHKPSIIIVALGGNDGLRGLPFSEIETSLGKIIKWSQQQGIEVLIAGVRLPPNYGAFYNSRYAALFEKLASTYKVRLIPQLLANVSEHSELMQADGIHPLASAQDRIVENVWPQLIKVLGPALNEAAVAPKL